MKCITCDNERDIYRGGGYLRTRCRICWNKYCKDNKYKHKAYFAAYLKEYIPEWRKKNKSYLAVNNKCNKKAIKELRESYLKNIVAGGKAWNENLRDFIDVKKFQIKILRYVRNGTNKTV